MLELEDALRHGNISRKSLQRCRFHQDAILWHKGASEPPPSDGAPVKVTRSVTAYQLALSMEVLYSTLGAQAVEYQKRCAAARRQDVRHEVRQSADWV